MRYLYRFTDSVEGYVIVMVCLKQSFDWLLLCYADWSASGILHQESVIEKDQLTGGISPSNSRFQWTGSGRLSCIYGRKMNDKHRGVIVQLYLAYMYWWIFFTLIQS